MQNASWFFEKAIESLGGLDNFGPGDFRVPFEKLLSSFHNDTALNDKAEAYLTGLILHHLQNRLKIQDFLARFPGVREVPIKAPIFIVGAPRTGSTLVHNLMSLDPHFTSFPFWELFSPVPDRKVFLENQADNRIAHCESFFAFRKSYLEKAHPVEIHWPEECHWLLDSSFSSIFFGIQATLYSYLDWLLETDLMGPYQYFKLQLQVLLWQRAQKTVSNHTLLLKNPGHTPYLETVSKVFPDARFIFLLRDRNEARSSYAGLIETYWKNHCVGYDFGKIKTLVERLDEKGFKFPEEKRRKIGNDRFFDLHYEDVMENPEGSMARVSSFLNIPYGEEKQNRLKQWLKENPQNKHGKHQHSTEKFGLRKI